MLGVFVERRNDMEESWIQRILRQKECYERKNRMK